jgi:hypothetical protein
MDEVYMWDPSVEIYMGCVIARIGLSMEKRKTVGTRAFVTWFMVVGLWLLRLS